MTVIEPVLPLDYDRFKSESFYNASKAPYKDLGRLIASDRVGLTCRTSNFDIYLN